MTQGLDWLSAITLFGGVQGFILALALLASPRGNRKANRYLAFFLFAFSVQIFDYIYVYTGSYLTFPHALYLSDLFILAVPYLFYRYVKSLTRRELTFQKWEWLHIAPSVLYGINAIPFYFQNAQYKIDYKLYYPVKDFPVSVPIDNVTVGAAVGLGLVYLVSSIVELTRFRERLKNAFSSLEAVQLKWLINLMIGLVVILLISFYYFISNHPRETDIVIPFSMTVLMGVIGFMGFRQPEIFTSRELDSAVNEKVLMEEAPEVNPVSGTSPPPIDQEAKVPSKKYSRSSLKEEQASIYVETLKALMEEEKLYREPELNLLTLASQMEISTHHLSQILNGFIHKSFFDFVNSYRIKEARQLLLDSSYQGNLLDLVFHIGFNSKSSFYNAFKKHTGLTPTQYKQQTVSN